MQMQMQVEVVVVVVRIATVSETADDHSNNNTPRARTRTTERTATPQVLPEVVRPLVAATTTRLRRREAIRGAGATDQTLETQALVMIREAVPIMRTLQRIEIARLVLLAQLLVVDRELLQTATIQRDGATAVSAEQQEE